MLYIEPKEVLYTGSQKTMTVREGIPQTFTLTPESFSDSDIDVYLIYDVDIIKATLSVIAGVIHVDVEGVSIGTTNLVVCVKDTDRELGRLKVTTK